MSSVNILQHSPVVEQVRRLQSRDALNNLAFSHPDIPLIEILSQALESTRPFLPDELFEVVTVILDNVQYSLLESEATV